MLIWKKMSLKGKYKPQITFFTQHIYYTTNTKFNQTKFNKNMMFSEEIFIIYDKKN